MADSTTVTGTSGSAALTTLDPMYMLWTTPTVSGVTCTPAGGEPAGSAVTHDKHTVCCR